MGVEPTLTEPNGLNTEVNENEWQRWVSNPRAHRPMHYESSVLPTAPRDLWKTETMLLFMPARPLFHHHHHHQQHHHRLIYVILQLYIRPILGHSVILLLVV